MTPPSRAKSAVWALAASAPAAAGHASRHCVEEESARSAERDCMAVRAGAGAGSEGASEQPGWEWVLERGGGLGAVFFCEGGCVCVVSGERAI